MVLGRGVWFIGVDWWCAGRQSPDHRSRQTCTWEKRSERTVQWFGWSVAMDPLVVALHDQLSKPKVYQSGVTAHIPLQKFCDVKLCFKMISGTLPCGDTWLGWRFHRFDATVYRQSNILSQDRSWKFALILLRPRVFLLKGNHMARSCCWFSRMFKISLLQWARYLIFLNKKTCIIYDYKHFIIYM